MYIDSLVVYLCNHFQLSKQKNSYWEVLISRFTVNCVHLLYTHAHTLDISFKPILKSLWARYSSTAIFQGFLEWISFTELPCYPPTGNMPSPNAPLKRVLAYTGCFSRMSTIKDIHEYLSQRLRIKEEDMRLWLYNSDVRFFIDAPCYSTVLFLYHTDIYLWVAPHCELFSWHVDARVSITCRVSV